MQAEGHDLVRGVVADVGPAEPGDIAPRAPVAGDFIGLHAEGTVVFGHVADAPEPQPREPARREIGRNMEKARSRA